jgi:hypothetical protein
MPRSLNVPRGLTITLWVSCRKRPSLQRRNDLRRVLGLLLEMTLRHLWLMREMDTLDIVTSQTASVSIHTWPSEAIPHLSLCCSIRWDTGTATALVR